MMWHYDNQIQDKKSLFTVIGEAYNKTEKHVGDMTHIKVINYEHLIDNPIKATIGVFNKKDEKIGVLPETHEECIELMEMGAPIIRGSVFQENIHYLDNLKDIFITEISDCGGFVFIDTSDHNTYDILMELKKISENSIKNEIKLELKNSKSEKQRRIYEEIQMQQVLKAIEQGKSREEAAVYAGVTTETITKWYNEGFENKSPKTKRFYDEFTRIKKIESYKKNVKKNKLKVRKKPRHASNKMVSESYSSKPTSYMRKLQGDRTDTSDRARNLREDISGRY